MSAAADSSDFVAAEILLREPRSGGRALAFGLRVRWVGVLVFGPWGVLLTVPTTILLASGEIPPRALSLAIAPVYLAGLACLYLALRALLNGARLELDGGDLRFRRGPLWPFREQRIPLGSIAGTAMEIHPESFRYPATYRGRPTARPYVVHVRHHDGSRTTLPLALGARDAEDVAAWVARIAS